MYVHMCLRMYVGTTGPVLGYNLTHTTLFDYERDDLRHKSLAEMEKLASSYFTFILQLYVHNCLYIFLFSVLLIITLTRKVA